MLQALSRLFPVPFKSLAERFDKSPIDSVDNLQRFVRTRSSYIAQTSLHGYLKTRMGTQFTKYFENDTFSRSIRIAAIKLFASCTSDLAVFATALVQAETKLDAGKSAALSRHLIDTILNDHLEPVDFHHLASDFMHDLDERLNATIWPNAAIGEAAFDGSVRDLIRFAPVVDEFKALDEEIVTNSIRFRWLDVKQQLRKRLHAAEIASDWDATGPQQIR